jgi:DNA polymerase III subunit delta
MGALTLDALFRSLKKGAPDPVYLLHGPEDVLKDEAIRALIESALDPSTRDFNLAIRAAAEVDPEAFHALVNTPPLLAGRRVVVLRGVEQLNKRSKTRDELLRYLDAPNPTTVLVLVQGDDEKPEANLARGATAVALEALPPERVSKWVTHHAQELGVTLEPDAQELLLAAAGSDLAALKQELEKLAPLAAARGTSATQADVTALVGVRQGATVYDLVDAALGREAARAAQLVEPVLEQAGMTGVRVVTALGTALIGTALARSEIDRGGGGGGNRVEAAVFQHIRTARPYGLRSWSEEAARWTRWAGLWTAAELSQALRRALAADRALKSSTVSDERGIVTELVLGLAKLEREAA